MYKSVYICTPANEVAAMLKRSRKTTNAKVAQLVEHDLAKVGVASSNLVFRSNPFQKKGFIVKRFNTCSDGGTGRHAGLKILFPLKECGFDSRSEYLRKQHMVVVSFFLHIKSYQSNSYTITSNGSIFP
jgi:hypothetical protein